MSAPSVIGRIAGALATRRLISGYLVAMGEPPAGILETLAAIRIRYRDALIERAAPKDPAEREAWERA